MYVTCQRFTELLGAPGSDFWYPGLGLNFVELLMIGKREISEGGLTLRYVQGKKPPLDDGSETKAHSQEWLCHVNSGGVVATACRRRPWR